MSAFLYPLLDAWTPLTKFFGMLSLHLLQIMPISTQESLVNALVQNGEDEGHPCLYMCQTILDPSYDHHG